MKAKLTDVLIQKSKAGAGERLEIFDTQVPGFGVRIGARERAFFFVRRINGRKVRMSLGVYPVVSLAKARSQALATLDRIKSGEDPTYDLKRRKPGSEMADDTRFGNVADRFLAQYCRGKKTPLRTRTTAEYERHLTKGAAASWKGRALASVTEKDIISAIDKLEGQGHFATARTLKACLRKFFGWCVERRLIAHNPAIAPPLSSRPSDFIRERVLSLAELRHVLTAADRLDPPYRAFIYVLALCGQRRNETSVMRWSELDLDAKDPIWRLSGTVTKNRRSHDVPLSPAVVEILRGLPRYLVELGDADVTDYVFSGDGKVPVSGFSKMKVKIDKLIEVERQASRKDDAPFSHWTWHDLRRSAATGLANLGVAPHVVEAVLNHVSGAKAGIAGVYNKSTYDDERRKALEAWAAKILARGSEPNVIPLAKFA
jgi:integrase